MARFRRGGRTIAALALGGLLAGCGTIRGGEGSDGLELRFEDRAEPAVFALEGRARRDGEGGAAGRWAVVAGLPRPERALVENLGTGAVTVVALFDGGRRGEVRLSEEAADAIGIGPEGGAVRVTALRSMPVIGLGDR